MFSRATKRRTFGEGFHVDCLITGCTKTTAFAESCGVCWPFELPMYADLSVQTFTDTRCLSLAAIASNRMCCPLEMTRWSLHRKRHFVDYNRLTGKRAADTRVPQVMTNTSAHWKDQRDPNNVEHTKLRLACTKLSNVATLTCLRARLSHFSMRVAVAAGAMIFRNAFDSQTKGYSNITCGAAEHDNSLWRPPK